MRLIDADEFLIDESEAYISAQNRINDSLTRKVNFVVHKKIQKLIADAPTVDAEPIRYGEWIEMERGHYFKCSKCRNPIPYKFGWKLYNGVVSNKRYYNYCPNCGAKMDGERKNG